jgi:hypothetical protein
MADVWAALGSVASLLRRLVPKTDKRERERFEKIYAPMYALFITRHITTSSSIGAPYFSQRIENAKELFERKKYWRALKALFDKKHSEPAAEVEYGGAFPMAQIHKIVKGNEMYCDEKLLILIARADRSHYEDMPSDREVTSAQLALYERIIDRHRVFNKKYVGR